MTMIRGEKPLLAELVEEAAIRRRLTNPSNYVTTSPVKKPGMNHEQVTEQCVQCYELRLTGASIIQIAKALHIGPQTVIKRLSQHERAYLLPILDSVRKMEIARYDSYLLRLQPQIANGDVAAISCAVKISTERRKLLGADAPVEVNNRYPDGVPSVLDKNITNLLDEMEANLDKVVEES